MSCLFLSGDVISVAVSDSHGESSSHSDIENEELTRNNIKSKSLDLTAIVCLRALFLFFVFCSFIYKFIGFMIITHVYSVTKSFPIHIDYNYDGITWIIGYFSNFHSKNVLNKCFILYVIIFDFVYPIIKHQYMTKFNFKFSDILHLVFGLLHYQNERILVLCYGYVTALLPLFLSGLMYTLFIDDGAVTKHWWFHDFGNVSALFMFILLLFVGPLVCLMYILVIQCNLMTSKKMEKFGCGCGCGCRLDSYWFGFSLLMIVITAMICVPISMAFLRIPETDEGYGFSIIAQACGIVLACYDIWCLACDIMDCNGMELVPHRVFILGFFISILVTAFAILSFCFYAFFYRTDTYAGVGLSSDYASSRFGIVLLLSSFVISAIIFSIGIAVISFILTKYSLTIPNVDEEDENININDNDNAIANDYINSNYSNDTQWNRELKKFAKHRTTCHYLCKTEFNYLCIELCNESKTYEKISSTKCGIVVKKTCDKSCNCYCAWICDPCCCDICCNLCCYHIYRLLMCLSWKMYVKCVRHCTKQADCGSLQNQKQMQSKCNSLFLKCLSVCLILTSGIAFIEYMYCFYFVWRVLLLVSDINTSKQHCDTLRKQIVVS